MSADGDARDRGDEGHTPFSPRVALASLSGRSDAAWARAGARFAGCAFLGGLALDEPTREAARAMVDRDREEFLPADPAAFVDRQFRALDGVALRPGINVRSAGPDPLETVGAVCRDHGAVLEINAHCRQDEMCAVGAGESLLRAPDRLADRVAVAAETGAAVSVKVRAGVDGGELPTVARRIEAAGADAIHVDAMDSEPAVGAVADATDLFVIANNGVRGVESVAEYARYGADAVSVGRPSTDPAVLERVATAAARVFGDEEATRDRWSSRDRDRRDDAETDTEVRA